MKRQRRQYKGTGRHIQITLQVSQQKKPYYRSVKLGSINEVIDVPGNDNPFGKVWIKGDGGRPVVIFRHEYKSVKIKVKRIRTIPVKIKRTRKNEVQKIVRKRKHAEQKIKRKRRWRN